MAVIMIIINHMQNAELELRNTLGIAIRAVHMAGGGTVCIIRIPVSAAMGLKHARLQLQQRQII